MALFRRPQSTGLNGTDGGVEQRGVPVQDHETVGAEEEAGAPALSSALFGRHAELHSAGGFAADGLHAAVRLVERRGHTVRDVGGEPAVSC